MQRTPFLSLVAIMLAMVLHCGSTSAQWYNNYRSTAEYYSRLDQMLADHPDLTTPMVIGSTHEGREIRGIRITGNGPAHVDKKTVVIHGLIHAREWIAGMTTMYAADEMLDQYATNGQVANVLDNTEFVVVPVVNPDGYEYSRNVDRFWRKNRRNNGGGSFGVDLNRNFGFNWGPGFNGSSGNRNSNIYRGPSAFSEPESQALRDLFLDDQQIVSHIDFHSFGQIIAGPWGYTLENPPLVDILDRQASLMSDAIREVNGEVYVWGDDTNVLGIANGITNDWVYGDQGAFSYTVELRPESSNPGFDLPASQIIPTVEENLPGVLSLGEFTIQVAAGDFNFDDDWDCADVDELIEVIQTGSNRAEFDMNGDGAMDSLDLNEWLAQAGARNLASGASFLPGDANLDGNVDASDFNIWNENKFSAGHGWCGGDFTGDGATDGSDFNAWNENKFTSADVTAVPEPGGMLLLLLGCGGLIRRRGKK